MESTLLSQIYDMWDQMDFGKVMLALTAIGSLGAALAAAYSARQIQLVSEGQLFSDLYAEYGRPEMLKALRILRNWKNEKGHEFEVVWKKSLDSGNREAGEVDEARRHVKAYFMRAVRIYQAGYVSKRFVREVCSVDGINIFYDIVEPLEYALNPAYDTSKFLLIRKICGRAGTGRLMASVPLPRTSP
ncbi:MAG: hypothetical protein ACLGGZ_04350 [Alphaproteobacteria bacterium]